MERKVQIKRIEWMNQDNDLIVTVKESKDLLSYDSQWILPSESLNKILSEIQKQEEGIDINDYLSIEQWSASEINYVFNFEREKSLYIKGLSETPNLRQIRA
jgi:hypothetical protein